MKRVIKVSITPVAPNVYQLHVEPAVQVIQTGTLPPGDGIEFDNTMKFNLHFYAVGSSPFTKDDFTITRNGASPQWSNSVGYDQPYHYSVGPGPGVGAVMVQPISGDIDIVMG